jgi:hypothetical protein
MDDHKKSWGPAEHALTGAGVGAAGAGQSIALIGVSAGLALLPLSLVVGAVAGLAWWAIKAVASDNDQ